MAFIVGVLVGNLCGMFLMGLLVASRERNDADHAYQELMRRRNAEQSANK
jgi:fluoride ion exporter CrcB/FEX|tara:strand:+ start:238 stop:387 length:150 start_codon:yes stop_codon:yes gene_type:complete